MKTNLQHIFLLFLFNFFIFQITLASHKEILLFPEKGKDFSEEIVKIICDNPEGNFTLKLNAGEYEFFPEKAFGRYLEVSNNDNGYKNIAFCLENMHNVHIKGDGANLLFHGTIIPFYIKNCKGTVIEGINIDFDYSFIFEGEVIANNDERKSIDLKIRTKHSIEIKNQKLYFKGYNWISPLENNILFDKNTKRPYYYSSKYEHLFWQGDLKAKLLCDSIIRLSGYISKKLPPVGSIYTDKGKERQNRLYPCFVLHNSIDTRFVDINSYMSGAMTLIAENCENVSMERFNVGLKKNSHRVLASSADATHFVGCKGLIYFNDCAFSNMLDDATNIHGVYMKIDSIAKGKKIYASFGHDQQEGFNIAQQGDTINLIDRSSLISLYRTTVNSVKKINQNFYIIETNEILPDFGLKKLAFENRSNTASVIMNNCVVENNRARSVLISTPKSVLIENNYFSSMMAGILIAGDANKWCESGNVEDVVIRGNTFEDLGIGGASPQSVLQISPEIAVREKGQYYHGRIVFENNRVKTFDSQVIYALSVRDLIVRNNTFEFSKKFPPIFKDLPFFDFQNCKRVEIFGNTYSGNNRIVEVSQINCEKVIYNNNKGFFDKVISAPNTFFYKQ